MTPAFFQTLEPARGQRTEHPANCQLMVTGLMPTSVISGWRKRRLLARGRI
jgi:hypothetical protein